jgi:tetratricopeptide (TPR) repeat protein
MPGQLARPGGSKKYDGTSNAKRRSKGMMAYETSRYAVPTRNLGAGKTRWTCAIPRRLPACLMAVLLSACSSLPQKQPAVPLLEGHSSIHIPDVDLLRMTPEMRSFTARYAKPASRDSGKAWMLAYAVLDPYLLDFEYDPMVTLTADEAFGAGRGNCLTFSGMFVAMARDAGLQAWFQEVVVPPEWSAVNETLLVSKHVNAVVAERGGRYVVDVSRREKQSLEATRRMSDDEALAQYYNNLGADALVNDDLPRAHAYFSKALGARPGLPYVWSNLGVVLRRNGQIADAILAYRAAIDLDDEHTVALNNLHSLYTETGDLQAAATIQQQVEKNRRSNPYYLHYLAEVANEEQRWSDAIALLNRAIRLQANEYRFHYTLAQAQHESGHSELARASLARARELAPPDWGEEPLTLP